LPVVEYLIRTIYIEGNEFFDKMKEILVAISSVFLSIFSVVYLFIFIKFIIILMNEIWETNGILNMIPICVLEKNTKVKEQVLNRKNH